MKRRSVLVVAVVLVVALLSGLMVSCGGQKAGEQTGQQGTQTVVLKFASFQTGAYVDKEQAFVDRFNARCGPAYRIEYYPSEQMVGMANCWMPAGRAWRTWSAWYPMPMLPTTRGWAP